MAQSSPNMTSQLVPRVDPPHPAGTASPSGSTTTSETDQSVSACPTTIAYGDGGGRHPPNRVSGGLSGDAIALHTRARVQVAHSGPPRATQDGPRPPVIGPGPSIATAPRSDAAVTPPRTSFRPLRSHAVSPAPGSEMMAAVMEILRQQQEREDKRETTRARERAEDLWRKERDREQRDHARQLDSERAAERDRLLMEAQHETNAGIERLSRNIANSPRLSCRGTPTGTPVPAADDSPKPAPVKHPLRRIPPSPPYQAADRHPGSVEPTPPPHHVPVHAESSRARTSTVDSPAPHSATRSGEYDRERQERRKRRERDLERDREHRECDRLFSAGIERLRRAIANSNSPTYSHRTYRPTINPAADTRAGDDPPKPDPSPVINTDPRHEPHTIPIRYDPPPAHDECPEPVHAYSLDRVHDGRYSPYQQPPPQPMQPTVSDPPPASAHSGNQSTPRASADSRHSLEDGPSRVTPSVVGVSHGLDHEFTVRGDSAVLPPGSLTNVTLMQEPESTSHLAVVKADGNITLPRPLADVQGTTPMPCSLVADLSAPVPRETRQPDDPTDPAPDLVGDRVESGLASLRAPESAPGPMKGPPPALTVSDEVAPGTRPKVEIPLPPGFPPSQPLAVLQPLNAPPTTDDDDVRNASHVASDRDSTPAIGVPMWSTSAPRGWTAELQDYKKRKKRKKGKIVMDVVIMPWALPVSRDVFDHCCPPLLSRQSDPPPTHHPPPPPFPLIFVSCNHVVDAMS